MCLCKYTCPWGPSYVPTTSAVLEKGKFKGVDMKAVLRHVGDQTDLRGPEDQDQQVEIVGRQNFIEIQNQGSCSR